MPVSTRARAFRSTSCSVTPQCAVYQLFQPMGGVGASPAPAPGAVAGSARAPTTAVRTSHPRRFVLGPRSITGLREADPPETCAGVRATGGRRSCFVRDREIVMKPRLRKIMLVCALAVAPCTLAGAPANAAQGMEVAIQDDGPFVSQSYFNREKAFKLAGQLRLRWIRANVPWASVVNSAKKKKRPKHRKYDFAAYDSLLNAARNHGMQLQLTL